MINPPDLPNGTLEVRTLQRSGRRRLPEYRFTPSGGGGTGWEPAAVSEGSVLSDLAFSAGILLGQQYAELAG